MILAGNGAPRDRQRVWRLTIAIGVALWSLACARTPAPTPPVEDQTAAAREDYRVGPADVLGIRVWRNQELSVDVPVRPDGRISVPLLGDIQAAGLTTGELRDVIAEALAEYVTAPDVTVMVLAVNSKRVFLVGEVVRPAALELNVDMRVLDAIAAVGGFSPFANKRNIRILRPQGDGSVVEYRFNYHSFLRGNDPQSNLQLLPGDTIVVPD